MNIRSTLFLLCVSLGQLSAGTIARAEEELKEYDVEIIIFEDAHARYLNSELWPQNSSAATAVLPQASTGDSHTITVTPLADKLPKADPAKRRIFKNIKPRILSREYASLNKSSEFNVLFYAAWRQPGLERSDAFDIYTNELDNAHPGKSENTLSGHFTVELARYLHFYSELEYHRQALPAVAENYAEGVNNPDVSPARDSIFPMSNHSRMRSKELHYVDHPLVGMLIQINPVEKMAVKN